MIGDAANPVSDPPQVEPPSITNLSPDVRSSVEAIRNTLMNNSDATSLDNTLQQSQEQRKTLVSPNGIVLAGPDAQPTDEHPNSSKINYEAGSELTNAVLNKDRANMDPEQNPDVAALAYLAQKGGMQPDELQKDMERMRQLNSILKTDSEHDILTPDEARKNQDELTRLKSQISDAMGGAIEKSVADERPWNGHGGGYYGTQRLAGLPEGATDPWHTPDGKPYTVEPYPGIEFTIMPSPTPNVNTAPAKGPSR